MSFKVLVIPEDFTKDEHILKPLVEHILSDAGKTNAHVVVCRDPNLGGIGEALKIDRLRTGVLARYPMVDLFLLFVDRDGQAGREERTARIESALASEIAHPGACFLTELARQEVEVFILAGHDLPSDWQWQAIRADPDVKNTYFQSFVTAKGTSKLPHEGRKKLMAEAIKNWNRIMSRCPEDVGRLLNRVRVLVSEIKTSS
jgi:hypothetical protein